MPPRRPAADRNYNDMVDPNALHITEEQASTFGERREVLKESEALALRQQASEAAGLRGRLAEIEDQLKSQTSALSVQDGALMVGGFQFSPTGLIAPEQFSEEAWQQIGVLLFKLEGSIQWLIGDWIVYGGQVGWGDVPRIAQALGRDAATLHNYASVSRKVQFSLRSENLSYNHHVLVAPYSAREQAEYLHHAAENKMSVARFREWIARQQGRSTERIALSPELKFGAIARELDKFTLRDPSTAKPDERTAVLGYAAQLRTWLDALEKKWTDS